MEVLGIRFCSVTQEAESLAGFLEALGLPRRGTGDDAPPTSGEFQGAVYRSLMQRRGTIIGSTEDEGFARIEQGERDLRY